MDTDICIIGAGIIGIAIAKQLAGKGKELILLEKNKRFGEETSSRNSEVVHSGLYYPPHSLKTRLCLAGNQKLYTYCEENDIGYNKCGKLIVATTPEECDQVHELASKAAKNGVPGVRSMKEEEIKEKEANINALQALWVPTAGIVDSHSLMKKMLGDYFQNGGQIAYLSEVCAIKKVKDGYEVRIRESETDSFEFTAAKVINCAGLEAVKIARMVNANAIYGPLHFCKGEYFRIRPPKNKLLSHLIYPVPIKDLKGLGIHATIELDGGVKLGPNTIYLGQNKYDYSVDPSHLEDFFKAASRYLPFLQPDDLVPEMAGIRPKIQGPTEAFRDFVIEEETKRGFPGFVNLIGIESPGLTASLAIAEYVESLLLRLS